MTYPWTEDIGLEILISLLSMLNLSVWFFFDALRVEGFPEFGNSMRTSIFPPEGDVNLHTLCSPSTATNLLEWFFNARHVEGFAEFERSASALWLPTDAVFFLETINMKVEYWIYNKTQNNYSKNNNKQ